MMLSGTGTRSALLMAAGLLAFAVPVLAQPLEGPPADPRFRF